MPNTITQEVADELIKYIQSLVAPRPALINWNDLIENKRLERFEVGGIDNAFAWVSPRILCIMTPKSSKGPDYAISVDARDHLQRLLNERQIDEAWIVQTNGDSIFVAAASLAEVNELILSSGDRDRVGIPQVGEFDGFRRKNTYHWIPARFNRKPQDKRRELCPTQE